MSQTPILQCIAVLEIVHLSVLESQNILQEKLLTSLPFHQPYRPQLRVTSISILVF